jgi:hypothetical protein
MRILLVAALLSICSMCARANQYSIAARVDGNLDIGIARDQHYMAEQGGFAFGAPLRVIRMMEDFAREEPFLEFVKMLATRFRYRYLSLDGFRSAVEEFLRRKLDWFLHYVDTNAVARPKPYRQPGIDLLLLRRPKAASPANTAASGAGSGVGVARKPFTLAPSE